MIRIGAVNIDTSHPRGFAEVLENEPRAKYVGVYDDSFRSDAEVEGFIKKFGLEKRCGSIEELAALCDIGFVHGCNWDDHLRCARPFLAAGKPVFIDKPIVGSLRDCRELERLAREGAVILGASSVRYAYEVAEFLRLPVEERGEVVSIFGTSGVDEFNYGIHIAECISAIAGGHAESVRSLGKGERDGQYSESFFVKFSNGVTAVYNTFTNTWQPFALTIMTTKTTYQFTLDSGRLYRALIEQILDYMEGKPNRLAPVGDLTESVKVMLAGKASREQGGKTVLLAELPEDAPGYDGAAFYQGYAAAAVDLYH